jgi:hypothetical protein
MKNETYRKAFDNLNVPADMAQRIRQAAAEQAPAPKIADFPRRNPRRAWRGVAACACAAALGLLIWKGGLLPRRADRVSGSAESSAASESGAAASNSSSAASGSSSAASSSDGAVSGSNGAVSGSDGAVSGSNSAVSGSGSAEKSGKSAAKKAETSTGKETGTPAENELTASPARPSGSESNTLNPDTAPPPDSVSGGGMEVVNPVETVTAPSDLAGKLPFAPVLPAAVPEGWQMLSCAVVGGTLAQIVYTDGGDGEVCWRTAQGTSDVSGDFTDYGETSVHSGATLRGDGGTVSTAWWTADGMAFSLSFSPAVSGDAAQAWVAAVRG